MLHVRCLQVAIASRERHRARRCWGVCASPYNHIVVSDLHLGGGGHANELTQFLAWYAAHPADERPWRLVIAGDGIDFLHAGLADEEHTEERAIATLETIVQDNRTTFAALAAFVADGHELVFVGGNHDAELHWDGVQARLRGLLSALFVERLSGRTADLAMVRAFEARVRFCRWFFLEPGALYVEHGHQYDELCSFENVLYPVGPDERIETPVSHVTLRKFNELVHRMDLAKAEYWGLGDYVRWAVSLPRRPLMRCLFTYVTSPRWLFGLERRMVAPKGEIGRVVRDRVREIEAAFGLEESTLARLDGNKKAPAGRRWTFGLTMLFYDQLLLFGLCLTLLTGCLVTPLSSLWRGALTVGLLVATYFLSRHFAKKRDVEPNEKLIAGAEAVAKVVDVPYVVFGHTHIPLVRDASRSTKYVNTGSWTYEEGRTHFVVTAQRAALVRWAGTGRPVVFQCVDQSSPSLAGSTSSISSSACAGLSASAMTSSLPDPSSGPTL